MKIKLSLALLAATVAAPTLAQTQGAMNADAARQAEAADRALNARYAAVVASVSPATRLLLRDAQRSWIAFRDRQCAFEASGVKGGSAYPMVYSGCLARVTKERTRDLTRFGRCEEGDLSCPR